MFKVEYKWQQIPVYGRRIFFIVNTAIGWDYNIWGTRPVLILKFSVDSFQSKVFSFSLKNERKKSFPFTQKFSVDSFQSKV